MATLRDTSALASLNEQDYLNKLYDNRGNQQQTTLQTGYEADMGALNAGQQSIEQQTAENINRTQVEADKAIDAYNREQVPKLSGGAAAQAALSTGNQQQKNITELENEQSIAQAEIERQRVLRGQEFANAIKEAQAANDMQRAQALYEAAKQEDAQWLSMKQNAATLMAGKGDNSILDALATGTAIPENSTGMGTTWDSVLRYEDDINRIYDAQGQAEEARLAEEYLRAMSDLAAQEEAARRATDEKLNQTYVAAMLGQRNDAEMQNAYGRGSGTTAQARLARDNELRQDMTDLRGVRAREAAGMAMEGYEYGRENRDNLAQAEAQREQQRIAALIEAAEQEEQNNLANQQILANQALANGDYEILGAMYGLTPDQIDRLMGRGKYAPAYYGGDQYGGKRSKVDASAQKGGYAAAAQTQSPVVFNDPVWFDLFRRGAEQYG